MFISTGNAVLIFFANVCEDRCRRCVWVGIGKVFTAFASLQKVLVQGQTPQKSTLYSVAIRSAPPHEIEYNCMEAVSYRMTTYTDPRVECVGASLTLPRRFPVFYKRDHNLTEYQDRCSSL
jgi:hypothetical protein